MKTLSNNSLLQNDLLNILINKNKLTCGFKPNIALQILGRAMRGKKNGGNEENKIFLTKENYKKLSEYHLLESIVLNH
jgi:hypothetical protein